MYQWVASPYGGIDGVEKREYRHAPCWRSMADEQVDVEKSTATFYSGTILHDVHSLLANNSPSLAIPNIGSISDQTIGGLISTASHGSGVKFPVLSAHVKSLLLALPQPGAPVVRVSRTEDPELFTASLCGLGATGLMLEVEIEVEPAYRLRETKEPLPVDQVLGRLDEIKGSAEHVRVWWYPDGKGMVVARANRTYEVITYCMLVTVLVLIPACPTCLFLPRRPARLPCYPILPFSLPYLPLAHPGRWQMGMVVIKCEERGCG